MYFDDHAPPHFHVGYDEFRAIVGIDEPDLLAGRLPPRVTRLVIEWATLYRQEPLANWTSLAREGTFMRIAPLD